jgi:putative flippase GtrA
MATTKTGVGAPILRSMSRSGLVSVSSTAVDFAALIACVELLRVNYVLAAWLGMLAGCLWSFTANRLWAFGATASPARWQLLRFVPVQSGYMAFSTFGVWLFTEMGGLTYIASRTVTAILVYLAWNYPMNRWFVFVPAPVPARVVARSGGRGATRDPGLLTDDPPR